jgi:hypothetical protein
MLSKIKDIVCSICNIKHEDEYGHNAQPINNGRCCSVCNIEVVIPTRIKLFQAQLDYKPKKKEEE